MSDALTESILSRARSIVNCPVVEAALNKHFAGQSPFRGGSGIGSLTSWGTNMGFAAGAAYAVKVLHDAGLLVPGTATITPNPEASR